VPGTAEILSAYFNKKPHERVVETANGITVPTRLKLVRPDMSSMQKLMSLGVATVPETAVPSAMVDTMVGGRVIPLPDTTVALFDVGMPVIST
jgi:hypothetical protein